MTPIEHHDDAAASGDHAGTPTARLDAAHESAAPVPRRRSLLRVLSVRKPAGTPPPLPVRGAQTEHVVARVDPPVDDPVPQPGPSSRGGVGRRRGGRADFDAFYGTHYPSVVRLAYSLCGSWSIAEELSQEAFVTAHARWRRIESFDRPDLWVRRVVINRSISFRRSETSERRAVERISEALSSHDEPVVGDETVWEALRELSPRQAEVLALFYVEDQPLTAVAEILDLGLETVRTHLKRGRAALAAKLEEQGHVR